MPILHLAEHLSRAERIQFGSYYTPKELVNKVYEFIKPYTDNRKKNVMIFDSAGGCGAFLENVGMNDYRIADCNLKACEFLMQCFDKKKVFHTNSLISVNNGEKNATFAEIKK